MKNLLKHLIFAVGIVGGVVIAVTIETRLNDFESYLMKLDVGWGKVVIDASSSQVLKVDGKLISSKNVGVNTSYDKAYSLNLNWSLNLDNIVKLGASQIDLAPSKSNVFTKKGYINYWMGNVNISNKGGNHFSIGPGWSALVNVNNGALRVNASLPRPVCDRDSVWLIVWDSSAQKLIVCEAKTDFYGRPIAGSYAWHQFAR